MAIASLILGIVGFFLNPLYLVSIAAIVTGVIGRGNYDQKGMATAGLILGICTFVLQCIGDILITLFTFGLGFFAIFF